MNEELKTTIVFCVQLSELGVQLPDSGKQLSELGVQLSDSGIRLSDIQLCSVLIRSTKYVNNYFSRTFLS